MGPKSAERLQSLALETIGDVARADLMALTRLVGEAQAAHLQALARGEDDRPVVPDREAKSIGSEETLAEDIRGNAEVSVVLRRHCDRVAERLRSAGLNAGIVRVKIRYSRTFQLATREAHLSEPCDDSRTLRKAAVALLDKLDLGKPIRLVGVAAAQLEDARSPVQGDLFEHKSTEKHSRLEHTLDSIRERFGDIIRRADD